MIFGGTIIKVIPQDSGGFLEVLQRPLGYRYEPIMNDQTGGRFLVKYDGFLDDKIYLKNRKITLAGEILGSEVRMVDQVSYTYPVLKMQENHLWPYAGSSSSSQPRIGIGLGVSGSF